MSEPPSLSDMRANLDRLHVEHLLALSWKNQHQQRPSEGVNILSKPHQLASAGRFGRSPTRNSLRLPKRSIAQKQKISRRYGSMSWRLLLSGCFASHDRHHHPRNPNDSRRLRGLGQALLRRGKHISTVSLIRTGPLSDPVAGLKPPALLPSRRSATNLVVSATSTNDRPIAHQSVAITPGSEYLKPGLSDTGYVGVWG